MEAYKAGMFPSADDTNSSSFYLDTDDISKELFKQHYNAKNNYESFESMFNTGIDNELQSMMVPNATAFPPTGYYESTMNPEMNASMLNCSTTEYLNITCEIPINLARPMYGYIAPFLLATTTVANTLIVVVLSRRHMRTPTNAVLMAMALCDMFTLLVPAPWLFYMYTFGNHYKPLYPVEACYAWNLMNEVSYSKMCFKSSRNWLMLP